MTTRPATRIRVGQVVCVVWIGCALAGLPCVPTIAEGTGKTIEPLRAVALSDVGDSSLTNPIDRLLAGYLARHGVERGAIVDDVIFARRVGMDLIGLRPTAGQLTAFLTDTDPDKRAKLVDRLLADRRNYTEHWLTFWNDALRNGYRGTGYIDDGRRQITGWLYRSLYENKPFDAFVRELIDPVEGSEGFVKGIQWRGVVNASQRKEMQAAQTVSQVFLGLNLKCASCHDSFVNEWKLDEAYRFAAVFSAADLEVHRCDQPAGRTAGPAFLFEGLGEIDASLPLEQRLEQLAGMLTDERNGRLARTSVNRLWAAMMGRGLIEPLDDMTAPPWHGDALEWLAQDLVANGWDLKRTLRWIATSRAYQRPAVAAGDSNAAEGFVFRGPLVRRMTAEQFVDAVHDLTGAWPEPSEPMLKVDGRGQGGQWAAAMAVLAEAGQVESQENAGEGGGRVRASLMNADALQTAMGRSNREQVVTRRESAASTLEALELTNGAALDATLRRGGQSWATRYAGRPAGDLVDGVYRAALGRMPNDAERAAAVELMEGAVTAAGTADLLWVIVMLPEFQLIH